MQNHGQRTRSSVRLLPSFGFGGGELTSSSESPRPMFFPSCLANARALARSSRCTIFVAVAKSPAVVSSFARASSKDSPKTSTRNWVFTCLCRNIEIEIARQNGNQSTRRVVHTCTGSTATALKELNRAIRCIFVTFQWGQQLCPAYELVQAFLK